ncbi:SapB/AmfS family lanthipeptide [Cellulomonas soli]|nr:SapB/AmfS family lanthipeptide [Cellulomonas soli]NYI60277.1 hypothetical protein [Cellulomonas soli]
MGFLLALQSLDEHPDSQHHQQLASAYSLTVCVSTTSQAIC